MRLYEINAASAELTEQLDFDPETGEYTSQSWKGRSGQNIRFMGNHAR